MAKKGPSEFTALKKAVLLAKIAHDRRGEDILVLDVKDILVITDYFVLVTGMNKRQLQAISIEMGKELKARGITSFQVDGYEQGWWVLVDAGDVVVHLFQEDAREYYSLENLWGDAKPVDWEDLKKTVRRKKASPPPE
jgi:ribosome-associated protein